MKNIRPQPGDVMKISEVSYGSIVIMPDGGEVEVMERNHTTYNHKTRSMEYTSVRIRQGASGGLVDPNILVTMKENGYDRDLQWQAGQVVRIIGGKHVGKTGLVGKTVHSSGQVPIVTPDNPGEILRVKGSLVQRAVGRLEVEDPT